MLHYIGPLQKRYVTNSAVKQTFLSNLFWTLFIEDQEPIFVNDTCFEFHESINNALGQLREQTTQSDLLFCLVTHSLFEVTLLILLDYNVININYHCEWVSLTLIMSLLSAQ